jgi:Beta-lactamase enzyme family
VKWPVVGAVMIAIASAALVTPAPAAADCPPRTAAADCDLQTRIAAAEAYLGTCPGVVGYVVRDRSTAADRNLMVAMLHSSDDDAADTLWMRFGGADHLTFNANFPRYGMTDLQPQRGLRDTYPYWGFQKTTANDLDRLVNYVLTGLEPAQTAAIVHELQNVAPNQQWGVWGAGPAMAPGNKDGWSLEQGGWVTNSVGFAGAGQRYTLAMMNALGGAGGEDDGVATTTHLAEILLAGR